MRKKYGVQTEKQLELEDWMRMYGCDIFAINNNNIFIHTKYYRQSSIINVQDRKKEYVEVSNLYRWVIIIAVGRMRQRLPSFPVLLYGVYPYISL